METIDIGSSKISYEVFGKGDVAIVIDSALGSCSAEWWHIGQSLSEKYKVVVYDRSGYGNSTSSILERTPANAAIELYELISNLGLEEQVILVGHSQGGYYVAQFALQYPEKVRGIVLLDPATPFDDEFKEKLTKDKYKNSGIDKTLSNKLGKLLTGLGLGFLLKPLLLKSPPFYYHQFEKEASDYIIKNLTRKRTYSTALEEYKYTHSKDTTLQLSEAFKKQGLKDIPLILITHSTKVYIEELKRFAALDTVEAEKIESLWQSLMKRYLKLSSKSEWMEAPNSGHYIHLTDNELLMEAIDKCVYRSQD